jgi:hypothetical protein
MLRYGFLPSDFHPMVLFLGEAEDLRRFAGLMRDFSRQGRDVEMAALPFLQAADPTPVLLTTSGGKPGMRAVPGAARSFVWTLEPWQAALFCDMVGELTQPGCRSGSVFLEAATDEIRVKVSLGEYTDDFLAAEATKGGRS